jgi:hypothetical protein
MGKQGSGTLKKGKMFSSPSEGTVTEGGATLFTSLSACEGARDAKLEAGKFLVSCGTGTLALVWARTFVPEDRAAGSWLGNGHRWLFKSATSICDVFVWRSSGVAVFSAA